MNAQVTPQQLAQYDIKTVKGHITAARKKHIKAIFAAGLMTAKANRINYEIEHKEENVFTVRSWWNESNDFGQTVERKSFDTFELVGYVDKQKDAPLTVGQEIKCEGYKLRVTKVKSAENAKKEEEREYPILGEKFHSPKLIKKLENNEKCVLLYKVYKKGTKRSFFIAVEPKTKLRVHRLFYGAMWEAVKAGNAYLNTKQI